MRIFEEKKKRKKILRLVKINKQAVISFCVHIIMSVMYNHGHVYITIIKKKLPLKKWLSFTCSWVKLVEEIRANLAKTASELGFQISF